MDRHPADVLELEESAKFSGGGGGAPCHLVVRACLHRRRVGGRDATGCCQVTVLGSGIAKRWRIENIRSDNDQIRAHPTCVLHPRNCCRPT